MSGSKSSPFRSCVRVIARRSTLRIPKDGRDAFCRMAFEFDGHVVRGFAALREYAEAHTRVLRGRHMTLNHLYDVDGERATGCATTVVSIAAPSGYKIMGQGAYHDDLVKFGGKWRIRHRRVVNDHLVSDPAMPVNLADPDVAALVRQLIDAANNLAQRGQDSSEKKT